MFPLSKELCARSRNLELGRKISREMDRIGTMKDRQKDCYVKASRRLRLGLRLRAGGISPER